MSGHKNTGILISFVLAVGLLSASFTAVLMTSHYNRAQFQLLNGICRSIIDELPEAETVIPAILKDYKNKTAVPEEKSILATYGYRQSDFSKAAPNYGIIFAAAGFLFGGGLFLAAFRHMRRKEMLRIKSLTDYLENVNTGGNGLHLREEEDEFSKLQDEIYKNMITMRESREEAKKGRETLAESLTDISHQLKTPLAALFMYQDIIRQDPGEEEMVKKFAAKSVKALERMQTLILNLLKMARLDADMVVFRRQNVKVRELLEDIKAELETRAEKEKKEIILTGDETSRMICDRDWMQEAVSNLVKNALDHTKEGGRVEISWEETGVGMRLQVEDNGSGIHPEDMYSIFKRFYRSRFSNDREGAGLGLPLTKAIVEGHGGTVGVDSVPGQGSVFTLFFPDNR